MNTRIAIIAAALVMGLAPIPSAMAMDSGARFSAERYQDVDATGSVGGTEHPSYGGCPMSSAAEGNANQQNRLVKQYGQTSGGTRC